VDWISLFVAGLLEVGGAVGIKHSDGFTRLIPSIVALGAMSASLALLATALRTIPMGTAYVIWTGVGAVGTALFGIVAFGESAGFIRLICIGLIVLGISGLYLFAPAK
jgi:quaternary ammonium compound-resistance protein SugE